MTGLVKKTRETKKIFNIHTISPSVEGERERENIKKKNPELYIAYLTYPVPKGKVWWWGCVYDLKLALNEVVPIIGLHNK